MTCFEASPLSLGDDVTKTTRQLYYTFRRIKNFACVEIHPQTEKLLVISKPIPAPLPLEPRLTCDVTKIGHFGTGNLEVTMSSTDDFERAQPLNTYELSNELAVLRVLPPMLSGSRQAPARTTNLSAHE